MATTAETFLELLFWSRISGPVYEILIYKKKNQFPHFNYTSKCKQNVVNTLLKLTPT